MLHPVFASDFGYGFAFDLVRMLYAVYGIFPGLALTLMAWCIKQPARKKIWIRMAVFSWVLWLTALTFTLVKAHQFSARYPVDRTYDPGN